MKFIFALLLILTTINAFAQVGATPRTNCIGKQLQVQTTIASGQTTSAVIDTDCYNLHGIQTPAAFTGTSISFQVSSTASGTFVPVYGTAGTLFSITAAPSRYLTVDLTQMRAYRFLKIVSNATEAQADTLVLYLSAGLY